MKFEDMANLVYNKAHKHKIDKIAFSKPKELAIRGVIRTPEMYGLKVDVTGIYRAISGRIHFFGILILGIREPADKNFTKLMLNAIRKIHVRPNIYHLNALEDGMGNIEGPLFGTATYSEGYADGEQLREWTVRRFQKN